MRVEPHMVGSYVHVVKRGARGLPITGDLPDKRRFLRLLFYMNDRFLDDNWNRVPGQDKFSRSAEWPEREPLVAVLAHTLMPNHMHLILRETQESGIAAFMQKIGQSMTNHYNEKYHETGSIFQGSYRGRTIADDTYLRYVSAYVMVKNVFELYPKGGLRGGTEHFDDAWQWAITYPFSSLGDFVGKRLSPILDNDILGEIFPTNREFKDFARDVILGGKWLQTDFE